MHIFVPKPQSGLRRRSDRTTTKSNRGSRLRRLINIQYLECRAYARILHAKRPECDRLITHAVSLRLTTVTAEVEKSDSKLRMLFLSTSLTFHFDCLRVIDAWIVRLQFIVGKCFFLSRLNNFENCCSSGLAAAILAQHVVIHRSCTVQVVNLNALNSHKTEFSSHSDH